MSRYPEAQSERNLWREARPTPQTRHATNQSQSTPQELEALPTSAVPSKSFRQSRQTISPLPFETTEGSTKRCFRVAPLNNGLLIDETLRFIHYRSRQSRHDLHGAFVLAEIQKTLVLGVHNLLGIRQTPIYTLDKRRKPGRWMMEIEVIILLLSRHAEANWKRDVRSRLRISQNTRQEPALPDDVSEHMQRKCNGYQDQCRIPISSIIASSQRNAKGPKPERDGRY